MLLLGQSGEFAFQVSTETPVFLEDKGFFLKRSAWLCCAVRVLAVGLQDCSSTHFAAMVLSADERRELRRLLDKMDSADGVPDSGTAAMTDGAKRLRDDLGGYPETGSAGSSGMSAGSQMPITKPVTGRGSNAVKKAAAEVPVPSEEEETEDVIVVNYTGTGEVVPLPTGISLTEWDLTICELPKVVAQAEWKGKSYSALVAQSHDDNNLATYLNWVKEKFGKDYEGGKPRSQAVDFAGYLKRVGFSKEKGFRRKLAGGN